MQAIASFFIKRCKERKHVIGYPFILPTCRYQQPALFKKYAISEENLSSESTALETKLDKLESLGEEVKKVGRLCLKILYLIEEIQQKKIEEENACLGIFSVEKMQNELLPVFESFHRLVGKNFNTVDVKTDLDAVSDGLKIIYEKFLNLLENTGFEVIPTIGELFDPDIHKAVKIVEIPGAEPGMIIEEISPGYRYNGKIIIFPEVTVQKTN